ncbi:hypothetical protein [Microbacterium sp. NPDC056057]|uniref:hypothetical protein n=1 Tax=Microbacterium sp. NPDC056057 TaxID=3345699 RepID=UPI0035D5E770
MRTAGLLGYNSNKDRPFLIREATDQVEPSTQEFLVRMASEELQQNSWDWTRFDTFITRAIQLTALFAESGRQDRAIGLLDECLGVLRGIARTHPGAEQFRHRNRVLEAICNYNVAVLLVEGLQNDSLHAEALELVNSAVDRLYEVDLDDHTESYGRTMNAVVALGGILTHR